MVEPSWSGVSVTEPKFKRILLKLGGEALAGADGYGIDAQTLQELANTIAQFLL